MAGLFYPSGLAVTGHERYRGQAEDPRPRRLWLVPETKEPRRIRLEGRVLQGAAYGLLGLLVVYIVLGIAATVVGLGWLLAMGLRWAGLT